MVRNLDWFWPRGASSYRLLDWTRIEMVEEMKKSDIDKSILLHEIRLLENRRSDVRIGYIPGLMIIFLGLCLLVVALFV